MSENAVGDVLEAFNEKRVKMGMRALSFLSSTHRTEARSMLAQHEPEEIAAFMDGFYADPYWSPSWPWAAFLKCFDVYRDGKKIPRKNKAPRQKKKELTSKQHEQLRFYLNRTNGQCTHDPICANMDVHRSRLAKQFFGVEL